MKLHALLFGCLFGAAALLSSQVLSQETAPTALSDDELLHAIKTTGRIGEYHGNLKKIRQSYEQTIKWWRSPGAEPKESTGQSDTERILGGRFMTQRVLGKWMGVSFEGLGILGYDNVTQKYVMTWMDDLTSRIMVCRGTCDVGGTIFTLHGEYHDPIAGKIRKIKTVLEMLNRKGETLLEMYDVTSPEQEFKFLEVNSKRMVRTAA